MSLNDVGLWRLPAPIDKKAKYRHEWEEIPNLVLSPKQKPPFGYIVNPDDPDWLLPVPKELELLEEAKDHLKRYSYRDVAAWLTTQSGRSISHMGLKKRLDIERKRKQTIAIKKYYAEKLRKILAQIEDLEHRRTGAKKRSPFERGDSGT